MLSRWFHRPKLHNGGEHAGKRVGWLELFYDLIFAAGILQLAEVLAAGRSASDFATFALHFTPLFIAWTGFTFYANRFNVDDVVHRALVIGNMLAVGAMAISSRSAMSGNPAFFAVAYASANLLLGGLYLRTWRQVPEARDYAMYWGGVFVVSGLCFGFSALVPTPWNYTLWALGIAVIFAAPLARPAVALNERYPLDMDHLSERYGLLTLILLGVSFAGVLAHLSAPENAGQWGDQVKGAFNLGITCALWWVYFDDVAGSDVRPGRTPFILWLYGHLPLTMGIAAVGVALKRATALPLADPADAPTRWLLAGSLALVLLAVALIDGATDRPMVQINEQVRIASKWVSAFVLLLVAQAGGSMTGGVFLAIVTAICIAQVGFDLMMAPLGQQDPRAVAMSTAEVAKMKRDGTLPAGPRAPAARSPADAVRLGAPPELRRDLYFFFLEGGWARVIASFVFLYLALNVCFAGLYMLEPSGVGGSANPSFVDAFYFSVQTLGTIGYGVLHPVGQWANLVVTLEAAVGMLFAALATGTVLAKAARPRAAVLFANSAVISRYDGVPTLMIRAANARGNDVVDAQVSVAVLMDSVSAEGQHMRRVRDLKLVRDRQPMFALSWTIFHPIDETSPLFGADFTPTGDVLGLVVTLMGHDGTYGQTIYARKIYAAADVRVGHRYVDVMGQLPDGRLLLDLSRIHDSEPSP